MLPIIFQNNSFILYSYPLFMGIGWGVGHQIFFSLTKLEKLRAHIMFWGIFLFAWIGAKLLFVFTTRENADLIFASNFWLGGGFVFYGGFLAGVLFVMLYSLFSKRLSFDDLWPVLPALTFGHALGRIGCFLAGCCYGAPTDSWIGMHMHGEFRYPTQLFEAIGLLGLGFYLLKSRNLKSTLVAHYLLGYGILRSLIEVLRGDMIRGSWGPLTPSQWISFFLILCGGMLIYHHKNNGLRLFKLK